ncbi:MAG: hypothetical protein HY313_05015 [Acidobacteria bacterium]|nr:hypothetical protein [Acidobacteriota bacterium]
MNTTDFILLLQKQSRQLVSMLVPELKSNLGTSHYRRLTDEEMVQRLEMIYRDLIPWLDSKDESALQNAGEDSGKLRFAEGIPLGQTVLALILAEKHLWRYLRSSAITLEENARRAVTEFFQKRIYYTSRGYEASLAESNRLARRALEQQKPAAVAPTPAYTEASKEAESEGEVSRGGQVGEFGG